MKKFVFLLLIIPFLIPACKDDDAGGEPPVGQCNDLTDIAYDPSPYELPEMIGWDVKMIIPADNPLTIEGVDLGHKLFFDPILSVDSTISCSSCHDPKLSFNNQTALSAGVNGLTGRRSSMSLINAGFFENGLFWDGRSPSLEDQALHPVTDPVEMLETWENVEEKMQRHLTYPEEFRKAFGVECAEDITRDMVTKALAQYERTLVSYNSRWEQKMLQGNTFPLLFSDDELKGLFIYFDELGGNAGETAGHCNHCHAGFGGLLTDNRYHNNNIEDVETYDDFPDPGLGGVTGKQSDIGKFRAPTLRNIALTAPYMHDGRFETLAEVIEHYNSGGHQFDNSPTGSIPEQGLGLSEEEMKALEAFLHTLTDTTFFDDPHYLNPFN
ncbi:MAG: cytochrome c peroxidase [Bacteroidota bacterium]